MSYQSVFNTVYEHLRVQNGRAVDANGACRYRTDGSKCCAIGALMSDDEYDELMEGKGITDLSTAFPQAYRSMLSRLDLPDDKTTLDFLSDLQSAHDENSVFSSDYDGDYGMSYELRQIAGGYHLTLPGAA